ncbi:cell division ATP-binding protein FtsE [Ursidibacter maritimus]|uniref:Cell division ATP-binding protein FtsE n=1 Tax=Ursidibacter maritimus TaxID=1331689 RepID=A0A949WG29_9PAST|nr:cell division ATP-binding protein FtsE [Ursidibacter maritimus]KAE9540141.1 cell division ATP-binding protein FtsE [Ursidibacter maritimus]MBV6523810.1 cell division ATP-binding protein FtsE [Ursidibacter maritimus]MBV6526320.1 cell division ATP-binding protein FtsE [Ursidibacter maritimus]MBV6527834.1 cell division ATP-binding protein FtsE [Ursidibacter maritimus]MBV6529213.1 cell division ATP-binding protein FtsE [Ursidibacter maritimus]
MIRFHNVSKAYKGGGRPALQGISFHLQQGEMAYITGHSGAGKTTLLKLIMGIERANGGQVIFNGHDITRLAEHELPFLRRQIGMVHQNYSLLTDRSILDNVALPLIIMGVEQSIVEREARMALERVGLQNKANFLPLHLSGGEQQRVDIARAIVHRPQLLLADEPTGNLDDKLSFEIFRLFEEFNKAGTTVLIATHDTNIIAQRPKPCLVLEEGHLKS